MRPLYRFILTYVRRNWEMRYFCYGLFKSDKVNITLLWLLIPLSLITYYVISSTNSDEQAWYYYFTSQQSYMLLQAYIIFNIFRLTPHAGIATANLVKSIFSTISEILGINNKYIWIDTAWQVLMYALLLLAIKHYLKRAKRTHI